MMHQVQRPEDQQRSDCIDKVRVVVHAIYVLRIERLRRIDAFESGMHGYGSSDRRV